MNNSGRLLALSIAAGAVGMAFAASGLTVAILAEVPTGPTVNAALAKAYSNSLSAAQGSSLLGLAFAAYALASAIWHWPRYVSEREARTRPQAILVGLMLFSIGGYVLSLVWAVRSANMRVAGGLSAAPSFPGIGIGLSGLGSMLAITSMFLYQQWYSQLPADQRPAPSPSGAWVPGLARRLGRLLRMLTHGQAS